MTIRELCIASYALAKEKGWYEAPVKSVVESICLVHAELSEAVEEIRKDTPPVYQNSETIRVLPNSEFWKTDRKPEGVLIELADAVIRIADLCESQGWDLQTAIELKHHFNKTREFRHGNKKL